MARRRTRRCNPRVTFLGRKRLKNGKLAKKKSRISFIAKKRRAGRTPKRLAKFAAKVRAGKVRRNRRGQILGFKK